jgi:predicted Zn finger-like uncharacterized protein
VKFLCDRCKTRYSIGDDRVRGKILKIRCKNCANVITVREGMDDGGAAVAAPAAPERRGRSTTGAPQAQSSSRAAGGGALGAAFASQLSKPPPALQEEWYVSIDGAQEGPLSLPEAQRWIGSKAWDADLHCWSEGFDDWLPVDKVSHFRGLRKRPPPPAPPPVPRPGIRPPRGADEPKPLFAATMAALEKGAGPGADRGMGLPPLVAPAPAAPPITAKANGTGVGPMLPSKTSSRSSSPRAATTQGVGPTPGAAALAAAFTTGPTDAGTEVEAPPFNDEIATAAEPVAAQVARLKGNAADTLPVGIPALGAARDAAPVPPSASSELADDDGLEIGEVSRVVKLADLVPKPKPQPRAATALGRPGASGSLRTGLTGAAPVVTPGELGMSVDPALAALVPPGQVTPDESLVAQSFAQRHRRGMLLLLISSALLVIGVAVAVVLVLSNTSDEIAMGLGGTKQIDTSRPEDIVRRQLMPGTGDGSADVANPTPGTTPKPRVPMPQIKTPPPVIDDPRNPALKASEVEEMAAKQVDGTQRCYMRAQKGAIGFDIANTKKIAVTLTVDKSGAVSHVQLSAHANDTFGQCLIARIKSWKFRESPGGIFRISLAFSSG